MNKRLLSSLLKYIFSLLIAVVFIIAIVIWWAIGDNLPDFSHLDIKLPKNAQPKKYNDELTVVTYNVGHGQGIKENAWDYRGKQLTLKKLNDLAKVINKIDADIYLLQEVDLDSNRTHRVNQIEFLKERSNNPYHACAVVWKKNYVPFPYWPPAHHIGYVTSANCILSKYPLSNHQRLIFNKPESNPFWYNWGYIDRGLQRADVHIGDKNFALLNAHLEAWDASTREKQIKVINKYIKKIKIPIILGGDFNTVLPGTKRVSNFEDDALVDYSKDKTLSLLIENNPKIRIGKLKNCDTTAQCFSFPSNDADRRLDHIFLINKNLKFIDYQIINEAGQASDHLPVKAKISID